MTSKIDPSTRALVLFSGGQDSAVCLAWALDRFGYVETVGFDYGQRHHVEMQARLAVRSAMVARFPTWSDKLGDDTVLDIQSFGAVAESSLTREREIELNETGLPSTFVPGRNLVFLIYAAALADRRKLSHLVGGMCETDYSGYPDCRRNTLDAMQHALNLGMDQGFTVDTPLMHLTKAETWGLAKALGGEALVSIILEESHTCYLGQRDPHPWGKGCGTCPACELRSAGYQAWDTGGRQALDP